MEHFFHADDGERIHLRLSGQGPALVLLHGWTSSHRDWNPFVDSLARSHTVFRWDARGHGGHTLQTRTVPTLARMARDLAKLIEHWSLEHVVLVGHSMGALTLWQYIRDYGCGRLAGVVTLDQSPRLVTGPGWRGGIYGDFDAARNRAFIQALRDDFAEAVLRLVGHSLNAPARALYDADVEPIRKARRRLASVDSAPLIACWESLSAADLRDVPAQIRVPALLVHGGASNFYPLEVAHFLADTIADARLRIFEGADHSPHLMEPARFTAELTDVLAALRGEPRHG